MLPYCLKCQKNTESKNLKVVTTENGRVMLLSKCPVCNSKKSTCLKEQEVRELLSNLTGVKIPVLSDSPFINTFFQKYKMNTIVNKLSLAEDKFMPEMHLEQLEFPHSTCGLFTKNKERIKKN